MREIFGISGIRLEGNAVRVISKGELDGENEAFVFLTCKCLRCATFVNDKFETLYLTEGTSIEEPKRYRQEENRSNQCSPESNPERHNTEQKF
jgi:hypothetical protein